MTDLAAARRNIDLAYGALLPIRLDPAAKAARQHLIAAKNALRETVPPPAPAPEPPPPPPPPVFKRIKGAIIVNAGNCSPDLLRQAGISHVAVEILGPNLIDLATSRWDGFVRGGLFVSRGGDTANEVDHVATIAGDNKLSFLVIDTEAHKADMGGKMEWTEGLYEGLRQRWPALPIYNITFGVHSSPAVVNHVAFRKHGVVPLWETYGGDGATLGVARTVSKANAEGWNPAHICFGDKSLAAEVAEARALSGLGDCWVWAPEQAGVDVLEMAKVPLG